MGEVDGDDDEDDGDDTSSKKSLGGTTTAKTPKGNSSSSTSQPSSESKGSSSPAAKPTLDARAQFGANLFLLSGMELGYVISTVEQECPKALENIRGMGRREGGRDDCHIEINVDSIPTKIFDQLNTYVQSKVGGANSSSSTKSKRPHSPGSDKKGPGRPKKKQKKV